MLSFVIEAHGYGAILTTPGEPDAGDEDPDGEDEAIDRDSRFPVIPMSGSRCLNNLLRSQRTKPLVFRSGRHGEDSQQAIFVFKVEGIEIEGFNDVGVDVQYPWEDTPRRFHEHGMQIKPFYIDKYPVTNAGVQEVSRCHALSSTGRSEFSSKIGRMALIPSGWAKRPVTWVSLEDAAPMRSGRGSGCRMSGSGNMPHRVLTVASIHGAMPGTRVLFRCRTRDAQCADRMRWMRIRLGQVPLA